jgi:hypothetical protein
MMVRVVTAQTHGCLIGDYAADSWSTAPYLRELPAHRIASSLAWSATSEQKQIILIVRAAKNFVKMALHHQLACNPGMISDFTAVTKAGRTHVKCST